MTEAPATVGHPNPLQWWAHRRRLAYTNQLMLILTFLAIVMARVPAELIPLAQTLTWINGLNVIAYYGGNAIQEYAQARSGR